ncbi:hypothetical protein Lfu02_32440 [Longispora fulva]|uniref:Superfamily I DNA/RNA helicase n=1 Tax=Longispora fulva TaxID=619741 RepID=A0A8J7GJN0_9ACTN|nr:helix-turn-helix domain-containing protein [Longispora fulva]MBG6139376.1 superfamily I DNA/RNA helicase [Longispora fulva]GIG58872.1 hypothetical protein Lfu02_32440 [Longispora fulva]
MVRTDSPRGPAVTGLPALYRPAQVAVILDCSEWWVKEQARKKRIPFAWIGGSYRFTEQHITEIIRLFEVEATNRDRTPTVVAAIPRQRRSQGEGTVIPLKGRTPPRVRAATLRSAA